MHLIVKNLTKKFETSSFFKLREKTSFVAVDNISFNLQEGEILGLLGANGAGKTTTIHMLLGILTHTSGQIEYFGKNFFKHKSEILQNVSFASTYVNLPSHLTINENLLIHGRLYGFSGVELNHRIEKFLKFFDMWSLRGRLFSGLSSGQRTRVALAKAFLTSPKIILLDEPTASLDPDIAHQIREFILEQQRNFGLSVLFTSHNMDEVAYVCNRVLVLQNGKIIASDKPENLASSVSMTKVQLVVGDGLKRTINFVEKMKLNYKLIERSIEIEINEHQVAQLLSGLAHESVSYSEISIARPTLEDYFLQIANQGKFTDGLKT